MAIDYDVLEVGDPAPDTYTAAPLCLEESDEGFNCTRPDGHDGRHVALGTEVVCDVWLRSPWPTGRLIATTAPTAAGAR